MLASPVREEERDGAGAGLGELGTQLGLLGQDRWIAGLFTLGIARRTMRSLLLFASPSELAQLKELGVITGRRVEEKPSSVQTPDTHYDL